MSVFAHHKAVFGHNGAVSEDLFDVSASDEFRRSFLWYGENKTVPSSLVSRLVYCQEYEHIGDDILVFVFQFREYNTPLAQNL